MWFRLFLVTLTLLCLPILPAAADGILLPHPPDRPIVPIREMPNLSIKHHHVKVHIDQQVATTEVDQVFSNPHNRDLEGTYLFPIPTGAVLSDFRLDIDGKMQSAELLEAERARQIYEEIVRRRIDPALVEYAGHNLYRARIFPIPAKGDKRIGLRYNQVLTARAGLHEYRYTLSTEKFSAQPLQKVSVTVRLKSKTPLRNVYSPTHSVSVRRLNDREALVSYEENNARPDTDFVLYYSTTPDPVGLTLMTYREGKEDGYFMLLAAPQAEASEQKRQPKHMTLVLDTSGSMSGDKIDQAKRAVAFNLNQLRPEDRFHLISFSDGVEPFSPSPISASAENIRKALAHVKSLEANGGTDINSALLSALEQKPDDRYLPMLLFLTDGDPTVGETNFERILKNIENANKHAVRTFVFGVGFDVNIPFLDKLSQKNRGVSEYVRPEEDIEVKVSNLAKQISSPALSDLKLNFGSAQTYDVLPRQLPDLFHGSQLILAGRYRNPGGATVSLQGNLQGQMRTFNLPGQQFASGKTEYSFLPRLWASRKIAWLLDEIRLKGNQNQELVAEVIRLSKRYGIITEYTSFLVREDVDVRTSAAAPTLMREAEDYLSESKKASKGSWAISQSRNIQQMQSNAPAAGNAYFDQDGQKQTVSNVRFVAQRAFYQKAGVWQEGEEVAKLPRITVKLFGETYFALSRQPELQEILALGEQIEFIHHGQLVVIGAEGSDRLSPELRNKLKL
jgi:Ca-activated chloride channel family protein